GGQEPVIDGKPTRGTNDVRIGKGGPHREFAFPALADVERRRGHVGTDSGQLDESLHSVLLGSRREATRRFDVHGMKSLAVPFHVETDRVDHRENAGNRIGDSLFIVNVGRDGLKARIVRAEQLASAVGMARRDANEKAVFAQMLDDAAAEKAGSAEHGNDARVHDPSMRSILLAMMKSFSCSPLIFFVISETVAWPHPKLTSG